VKRFALGLAAALWLVPKSAAAAEADAESVAPPLAADRRVEIRVSGDAAAASRVELTARELLARLGVEPRISSEDEPSSNTEQRPLVIAHIDLRDVSAPSIDVEDGQTHEPLTRRRLTDISSLEAAVEATLHVLYWAVQTKLDLASEPVVAPEPRPEKPTPPRPVSSHSQPQVAHEAPHERERLLRLGLDVGPMLRMSSLGSSRIVPGGGVSLEPRAGTGAFQVGLVLSCVVHGTTQLFVERGGAAEVRPVQARLMPIVDWAVARDASAGVGVFGGFDSFSVTPLQHPDAGVAEPARTAVDPMLGEFKVPGMPIRFSGWEGPSRLSAARLGEHNTDVLREYGLTEEEIADLHDKRVFVRDRALG